jgi:peptidyl-prolyl cis-trans isomerase C
MKILREPLLHFMVLGALVYLAARQFDGESDRYRIDAGAAQRARIATTYQQQYGAPPTARQLDYLLDQYVRSEILFREGLALGLDRDDEIVRRRVVQKIEFLNEDVDAIDASDSELERFFASHQSRYVAPAAVSFTQVFFSADSKGEEDARRRAASALTATRGGEPKATGGLRKVALAANDRSAPAGAAGRVAAQAVSAGGHRATVVERAGAPDAVGDRFDGGNEFAGLSAPQAERIFGDSQLSAALFTAPAGEWAGPFRSAFGWHLIRIERLDPAQAPPLASVKDRVLADYLAAERDRRNEAEFRRLASKYKIIGERSPS